MNWLATAVASALVLLAVAGAFVLGVAYGAKHSYEIRRTPIKRDRR